MSYEQLQLALNIPLQQSPQDELESQKPCHNFDQCSLPEKAYCPVGISCTFCNKSQSFTIAPEHSSCCVREQISLVSSPYKSVGAQVATNTKKFAPQHDIPTQWVEKYWVSRGNNKYWYYRYCWMEGRKKNRVYIGSVNSTRASQKKEAVSLAIAEGESPTKIKQLIISWNK